MRSHAYNIKLTHIEAARLQEEARRLEVSRAEVMRRLIMNYLPYSQFEKEQGLVRPSPIHGAGFIFED